MARFWKFYWALTAITLGLYLTMGIWSLPKIGSIADGMMAFDLRPFGYDTQYAQSFLYALFKDGPEGRDFYLNVQQRLDFIFPAASGLLILTTIHIFSTGFAPLLRSCLLILPFFGTAFDYAENFYVGAMLRKLPDLPDTATVHTASTMTMLKSGFVTVSLLVMIVLISRAIITRRKVAK
ncbi:MAG: hypothetical protein QM492_07780 [Rhodobacterales bacterium]